MYNIAKKYLLLGLSLSLLIVVATFFFNQKEITVAQTEIATKKQTKLTHIKYEGAVAISEEVDNIDDLIVELDTLETAGTFSLTAMAQSITEEALKAFSDSDEHSLPLVSHWNVGIPELTDAMNPMFMIDRIEQGEHILASWKIDPYYADTIGSSYYEESIKKAAELQLPLVFILPAPESALTKDSYYKNLPKEDNPNVVDQNDNILNTLSPFGPDERWNEVGSQWSTTTLMDNLQTWYPNPPLIIFISEDEADKLSWTELTSSSRFSQQYPTDKDDNFKRILIGAKWIEKYRQMEKGFTEGFTETAWKNNTKFISYNKLSNNFGKSADWIDNATFTNQYINVWPLAADGVTVDFDLTGSKSDATANAPHVPVNNLDFMLKEAKRVNSDFAYQLSINDDSQITDPARYRGITQFALWFLRPSIIRQKSSATTKTELEPMFQEVVDSVELIHYNPQVTKFWESGELVRNGDSYLNENIPEQYQNDPRWFLLDVNENPDRPWSDDTNIKVWAFALVKGEAPNREWLIYAQSPENEINDVTITIPDYGNIAVDSKVNGSFYILTESTTTTETITTEDTIEDTENQNILIGARKVTSTDISLATKFASPNGNGNGTIDNPYSIVDAFDSLVAGDVLFLRGGIYEIPKTSLLVRNKSGTELNPIIIESYPGETAVLDGKNRTPQDIIDNLYPTGYGLYLDLVEYIYVRKIEVTGMWGKGIYLKGRHSKIEGCHVHHNFLTGIQAVNRNFYATPYEDGWNLITDNIVHHNSDADIPYDNAHKDGDNADGIAISSGRNSSIEHNTIYSNSDDGADTWKSNDSVVAYNLIYDHGKGLYGNGSGVKMGGNTDPDSTDGLRAIAHHNIVHSNKSNAFNQNAGKDILIYNNTSWNNYGKAFLSNNTSSLVYNNISKDDYDLGTYPTGVSRTNNSWNIGGTVQLISTDPSNENFLVPVENSVHIDIGVYAN